MQDLDARLWEDPFAAVARVRKDNSGAPAKQDERHSLPQVCDHLRTVGEGAKPKAHSKREAKLLVLGVMVSNAPYSDGEEQRRRIRYAVQAALNVAQFTPENAQHVGYFRFGSDTESLLVPFELYKRKNAGAMRNDYRAMVVWLEDEWFQQDLGSGPTPLARVESLALALTEQCGKQAPAASLTEQPLAVSIGILGPASSDTLRGMRQEAGLKRSSGRRGSWRWSSGKGCGPACATYPSILPSPRPPKRTCCSVASATRRRQRRRHPPEPRRRSAACTRCSRPRRSAFCARRLPT